MSEWKKQRDLLIEEALAFAQDIAANTPRRAVMPVHPPDVAPEIPLSVQRPFAIAEQALTDMLHRERIVIQRRLANFKAHQERFQREREDYFQKTLANARTNQWIPQNLPQKSTHEVVDD
jgi:hypothetical protein